MLENVSIIIPYKYGNSYRDKVFEWVLSFYKNNFPNNEIIISECKEPLFNKSKAFNNAVKISKGEILLLADADIIYNPEIISQGIKELDNYAWVIPYKKVINLTKSYTRKILKKKPVYPLISPKGKERNNVTVGGLNIVPRKNFELVNGFDERFVGWGREDDAFAIAMNGICGNYKRLTTNVYHLWHPRIGPNRNPNIKINNKLINRYRSSDKFELIKLVNENGHNK